MAKFLCTLAAWLLAMNPKIEAQNLGNNTPSNPEKVNWPSTYEPSKSKFFVHNELEINAPPEVVWEILMDAPNWPKWYKGAKNVVLKNRNEVALKAGAVFNWQTMGLKFESTIKEFVPYQRLSWESKKKIIQGYHAWLIISTPNGCKVITEESQNGWLTFLEKTFQRKKLHRLHDIWLAEIKQKAEAQLKNTSHD